MPITAKVGAWLLNNGYQNLCFVSYPHTGETAMTDFAARVQMELQIELRYQVPNASVFIDHECIPPGAIWPAHLKLNLARSLTMVAILSQIYFSDYHSWCGKEWAAMENLGGARFPGSTVQPIIPVLFRKTVIPLAATSKQYIDLSRNSVLGKRFFTTATFRSAIQRIVGQIENLAFLAYENKSGASQDQCVWPELSPFGGAAAPSTPPPLLSSLSGQHPIAMSERE